MCSPCRVPSGGGQGKLFVAGLSAGVVRRAGLWKRPLRAGNSIQPPGR